MKYDLAVIGGGPAGLMAARTAARDGMKVVLLERHRDAVEPRRLDASMFYFNFLTPEIYVEPVNVTLGTGARMTEECRNPVETRFSFLVPGFSIDYSGPTILQYNYLNLSPAGYRVYGLKDELWSFYFSRETLLGDLMAEATSSGAEAMTGVFSSSVENITGGVRIRYRGPAGDGEIQARRAIAADGLHSTAVESLGLNHNRPASGRGEFVAWVMDGIRPDADIAIESTWFSFNYPSISPMGLTLSPYYEGNNTSLKQIMSVSNTAIEHFIKHTRYAKWFKDARLVRKMAISVDVRTPLKEVVHGNVVLAGDSMGGMTGIMGGVASGYQAVKAIQKQEKNLPGFQEYHDWFYQAFACFVCHDHDKRRMMHRLLRKVCTDDEVDYIYRKLEKRTCHPAFVVFEEPEIFQDRPELYQKAKGLISQIGQIPLSF